MGLQPHGADRQLSTKQINNKLNPNSVKCYEEKSRLTECAIGGGRRCEEEADDNSSSGGQGRAEIGLKPEGEGVAM